MVTKTEIDGSATDKGAERIAEIEHADIDRGGQSRRIRRCLHDTHLYRWADGKGGGGPVELFMQLVCALDFIRKSFQGFPDLSCAKS